MARRVAVLCSGGGSNLQAILEYFALPAHHDVAQVTLVASDRASAGALDRARRAGVEALVLDGTTHTTGLLHVLQARSIDLLVLAGYLRLVPPDVTGAYRGRILNIHPALLPAFGGPGMYGPRVHEAVVAAGVRLTGATVHFVDEEYDRGPIVAQWPVPVFDGDTPHAVAERVLQAEHALFPRAIHAVAAGHVRLEGDRVRGDILTMALPHFTPSVTPTD